MVAMEGLRAATGVPSLASRYMRLPPPGSKPASNVRFFSVFVVLLLEDNAHLRLIADCVPVIC